MITPPIPRWPPIDSHFAARQPFQFSIRIFDAAAFATVCRLAAFVASPPLMLTTAMTPHEAAKAAERDGAIADATLSMLSHAAFSCFRADF